MVHRYDKMRRSQARARKLLEGLGGFVFFIQHSKWQKDIAGLWDGFAILDGVVYFLQIKSNRMPNAQPYVDFCKRWRVRAMLINVRDRKGMVIRKI